MTNLLHEHYLYVHFPLIIRAIVLFISEFSKNTDDQDDQVLHVGDLQRFGLNSPLQI